jgi:hypothetical protein
VRTQFGVWLGLVAAVAALAATIYLAQARARTPTWCWVMASVAIGPMVAGALRAKADEAGAAGAPAGARAVAKRKGKRGRQAPGGSSAKAAPEQRGVRGQTRKAQELLQLVWTECFPGMSAGGLGCSLGCALLVGAFELSLLAAVWRAVAPSDPPFADLEELVGGALLAGALFGAFIEGRFVREACARRFGGEVSAVLAVGWCVLVTEAAVLVALRGGPGEGISFWLPAAAGALAVHLISWCASVLAL